MSTLLIRILYILIAVVISLITLQLLRKKGSVKRDTPAIIGLIMSTYPIIKLLVYFAQGSLNRTNILLNVMYFAVGVVIFCVWGVNKTSLDTK